MSVLRSIKLGWMRLMVRTVGRLSDGIRIAFRDGFTSGVMLEYIYRNQPSGKLGIGKWIDKSYLRHPGWEVIRTRKVHLETLLAKAVVAQRELGREPIVLDVASGPAQYVLDVMAADGMEDVRAVCRDLDEAALALGRANAETRGLADRVRFTPGDALSAESLAEVEPSPTVAVSSGFYDWITDDALVVKSIALLFDLLPAGGGFVFTNQSGHVDLEMVESIFLDFHGEPLRMTTRPAEQINGWTESAGFTVHETLSDELGSYSVTLAQKPE